LNYNGKLESKFPEDAGLVGNKDTATSAERTGKD
jgi:hypothetical protein